MTEIWKEKVTVGFDPAKICPSKVGLDVALLEFTKGNFYVAALAVYYGNIRGSKHRGDFGLEVHSVQQEWMEKAARLFPGLSFDAHRAVLRYVFKTNKDPNVRWLKFARDVLGTVSNVSFSY